MRLKFSTKDVSRSRAYYLASLTRGRARKMKSKKRKALEKKSAYYVRGY